MANLRSYSFAGAARLGLFLTLFLTLQTAWSQLPVRGLQTDLSNNADRFQAIDMNGDGKTDLLYSRPGGGYAGVYLSHGDGTFRYVPFVSNGSHAGVGPDFEGNDIVVPLDINGDGKDDFLVYRPGSGYLFECLSAGDGTAPCSALSDQNGQYKGILDTFKSGSEQIIALDFNGDKKSDFLVWSRGNPGTARVYISNGDGTFHNFDLAVGGQARNGFADTMRNNNENFVALDINGDGVSDILFSSPGSGILRVYVSAVDKSGTIGNVTTYSQSGSNMNGFTGNLNDNSGRAVSLDLNGDKKGDFIWYQPGSGFASVFLSNLTSTQVTPNMAVTVSAFPLRQNGTNSNGFSGDLSSSLDQVTVVDLNGDGKSDMLWSRPGAGYASMYLSNGTQALTQVTYAQPSGTSNGFMNDLLNSQDAAVAVNTVGPRTPGLLVYRPGGGITAMHSYVQNPTGTAGSLTESHFYAYLPTFMTDLAFSFANVPLKSIVMPGTHDSAMYGLTFGAGDIAETQLSDFLGQLNAGARVFDFRFGYYIDQNGLIFRADGKGNYGLQDRSLICGTPNAILSSGFYMSGHTDICTNYGVQDTLNIIETWLMNNPKEIVILNMGPVLQGDFADQRAAFPSLLNATTYPQLLYTPLSACGAITCSNPNLLPQNVMPSQLWASNKRLVLIDNTGDVSFTGYAWNANTLNNQGFCGDMSGLINYLNQITCMDNAIQQYRKPGFAADADGTFLFLNSVLTPYGQGTGNGSRSPIDFANGTNNNGFNEASDPNSILSTLNSGKWTNNALNMFLLDAIVNGQLSQQIVGLNNQAWANMQFFNSTFPQPAGALSVGADGTVWAAGSGHSISIFKYVNNAWVPLIFSQPNVKKLAVDLQGGVFVVDGSYGSQNYGQLLHYDSNGGSKQTLTNVVQDVAVGLDGSVWAIGINGALFQVSGPTNGTSSVAVLPIYGTRLAISNTGLPWVIGQDNTIRRLTSQGVFVQVPGAATEIVAGADGSVFIVGTDKIAYRYDPAGNSFPSGLHMDAVHIAVDGGGHPWAVRTNGAVLRGALDQTH